MQRDSFLLRIFAGLLIWQAGLFSYGVYKCTHSSANAIVLCPKLGERFDTFSSTTLAATIGLMVGSHINRNDDHV